MRSLDLTNEKFGNLIVLKKAENTFDGCGTIRTNWLCRCECGNKVVLKTRYLRRGTKKDCGCKRFKYKDFWSK